MNIIDLLMICSNLHIQSYVEVYNVITLYPLYKGELCDLIHNHDDICSKDILSFCITDVEMKSAKIFIRGYDYGHTVKTGS